MGFNSAFKELTPHRSSTAVILYTVNTSHVRLDDEISTSAAH